MNHIVLVEDDPDDVYFFSLVLKKLDIDSHLTNLDDGFELLSFLEKKRNQQFLIFLDLNMPRMSGLETLQQLREQHSSRNHVVIIYTTSSYTKDIEEAYQLGANSYIVKPSSQADLSALLKSASDYWFNWNKLPELIKGF